MSTHPPQPGSLAARLRPHLPKSLTSFGQAYDSRALISDAFSGLTVGIVALPLAMAFAIASGLPPERGLFTAIVAGFLISLLSGSRFQIGGPTGAFVVIVFGIASRHGYAGLQVATLLAGVFLVLMGLFRFGALIKFIPYPVVTGFTSGIALVIFSTQVKDFFGLRMQNVPAEFLPKWLAYFHQASTFNPAALGVAMGSLGVIVFFRRVYPRIPGPIVAVVLASVAVWLFGLPVETIGSQFGEIPRGLPAPVWPGFSWTQVRDLVPDALTIALLAAIESLLCAVVADGMTGDRHNANTELMAQGAANLASVMFGGIPATGALARTATNIKSGARSPLSGVIHALTLLVLTLVAAPLASRIPLAALAALLVVVAWNMSEIDHFRYMFRAPRSDTLVMLVTFGLTVGVDLTLAVQVGIVLAALLFMRRMAEVTQVGNALQQALGNGEGANGEDPDALTDKDVPAGVEIYEINGPFFFGVADRLKDALNNMELAPPVFILRLRRVPAMDATGLNALREFHGKCRRQGSTLVLSGVNPQPAAVLRKSGMDRLIGMENIHPHIDLALECARSILAAHRTV